MSLSSAAVVAAIALLAPLLSSLSRIGPPPIVLQILLGVVVGPQVAGWASVDEPVAVLALIGLGFLLLLSGLEIDFELLDGPLIRRAGLAFAASFALAILIGRFLAAVNLVGSPALLAIILSATSLGIVVPALEDARRSRSVLGQLVIASASLAEVIPIVLLSLLFSERSEAIGSQVVLLAVFGLFVVAVTMLIVGFEHLNRIRRTLVRLQGTTAEIRVRGSFFLLMLFAALATRFGLEAILGTFLAGAILNLVDRDAMTHPLLRAKLHAVGYGVFIPFFFVSTGMSLDVRSLISNSSTVAKIPLFLCAIVVVRAVPALLYWRIVDRPTDLIVVALLQSTSLSIPVVAGQLGVDLGLLRPENYSALVAAGLVSVVVFPSIASRLLRQPQPATAVPPKRHDVGDKTRSPANSRS